MLDVAGHLSSFGWQGHGTALRDGAITRPLLVAQKKSLAGLGKDRDEAFPFWDHVFAAAAKTITIKIANSDDGSGNDSDDDGPEGAPTTTVLSRTATGILSNRRPTSARATPGDTTPEPAVPRGTLSVMAAAKREAARRALYAGFYRAFVMKSEVDADAPATKKRKRGSDDDDDDDDSGATKWRTLAAAVTAPSAKVETKSAEGDEDDKAAQKRAKAERKAAKEERRALRAAKREKKRLKAERKAAKDDARQAQAIRDSRNEDTAAAPAADASARHCKKDRKARAAQSGVDDAPAEPKLKKKRRKTSDE